MKKNWIILAALTGTIYSGAWADDFVDDIYFNPSKSVSGQKTNKKASHYIANYDQIDVDEYNRRGQYYTSPVDTIGAYAEAGEDFVYTQKIQKFYNPTIVVDNSDLLETVLANSYGNVEVVYDINGPYFSSIYSPWASIPSWWYSPYYNPYPYSPGWGISVGSGYWGPAWGWNWRWGPLWSWGWGYGPAWAYNAGFGPGWNWGWSGYYPPNHHYPHGPGFAQWTPGRNMPNRPPLYSGGNYNGGYGHPGHASVGRPGSTRPTVRPGGAITRPVGSTRPGGSSVSGTRPSIGGDRVSTRRPASNSGNVSRPGSSGTISRPTGSTSGNRGSSVSSGRSKSSIGSSSSSSSNRSTTVSRPVSSSSSRSSSAGRSSGGSRPSGGRGGRR